MLNNNRPYLVLDPCSALTQVGILLKGSFVCCESSQSSTLESLNTLVKNCLTAHNLNFNDLGGFLYANGPGSLLGVRICAIALRAWNQLLDSPLPVYTYNALQLAQQPLGSPIIAPYKKDKFILLHNDVFKEASSEELMALTPLYQLGDSHPSATPVNYDLSQYAEHLYEATFLQETKNPDAFLIREQEFVKWDGKRHESPN